MSIANPTPTRKYYNANLDLIVLTDILDRSSVRNLSRDNWTDAKTDAKTTGMNTHFTSYHHVRTQTCVSKQTGPWLEKHS